MVAKCAQNIAILPHYTPQLIAISITLVCLIGTAICYAIRELKRKKTFYGVEDKMEELDADENGGQLVGHCDDEVSVVQSTERSGRQTSRAGTPVKIMIKRRPISKLTTRFSGEMIPQVPSPIVISRFHAVIDVDRTGRGFEVIDCLARKVNEMLTDVKAPLSHEMETKIAETVLSETRFALESMEMGGWIVLGRTNNGNCKVSGCDNLGVGIDEMRLKLRYNVQQPFAMLLMAFKIDIAISPHTPVTITPRGGKKKRSASLVTASTPQTNTYTRNSAVQSSVTGISNLSQLQVQASEIAHTQVTQTQTQMSGSKKKTSRSGRPIAHTPLTPHRRTKASTPAPGTSVSRTPQTIPKKTSPVPVARTPRPQSLVNVGTTYRSGECLTNDTQTSEVKI